MDPTIARLTSEITSVKFEIVLPTVGAAVAVNVSRVVHWLWCTIEIVDVEP